jgi:hypothetical protein
MIRVNNKFDLKEVIDWQRHREKRGKRPKEHKEGSRVVVYSVCMLKKE